VGTEVRACFRPQSASAAREIYGDLAPEFDCCPDPGQTNVPVTWARQIIDILVQPKRDKAAALTVMRKLLKKQGCTPTLLIFDKL
jgi:hypothetical protein